MIPLQVIVILFFWGLGELAVWMLGIQFPGSIIGLLLLAVSLQMHLIKLRWVENVANWLVANMGLFYIPAGVALMLYFDIIKAEFLPIVVATIVSTIFVLIATAWIHQIIRRHGKHRK